MNDRQMLEGYTMVGSPQEKHLNKYKKHMVHFVMPLNAMYDKMPLQMPCGQTAELEDIV